MNAGRLIAVDIGNSSTKVGWFDESAGDGSLPQPGLVRDFPTGQTPPDELLSHLVRHPVRWRVASVQREGTRVLSKWVLAHRPQDDFRVLSRGDLPLAVRVDEPDRVGLDRLAAAVAAGVLRRADQAAIVVGAGTAVTVNLIAADGAFEGGAILAGFRMQAEVLFETADLLPLAVLSPTGEPPAALGKNSEAAIKSGLFWGAVGAVRELVERISVGLVQQPQLFVTGGDLARLAPLVAEGALFVPHMVLCGIAHAARVEAARDRATPPGKEAAPQLT